MKQAVNAARSDAVTRGRERKTPKQNLAGDDRVGERGNLSHKHVTQGAGLVHNLDVIFRS